MTDRKPIPEQEFDLPDDATIELGETRPGDDSVHVHAADADDIAILRILPAQAREVAASLVRRADLIDPPKRGWKPSPDTAESCLAEFVRFGKTMTERFFAETDDTSFHRVLHLVDAFTQAALMAELMRLSPTRAAEIARHLHQCWEDGGVIHELLWDWSAMLADGKEIGFAETVTLTTDLPDGFATTARVEWNPEGDRWLPATVVDVARWGHHTRGIHTVLIALDENGQQMNVSPSHLRPSPATLPLEVNR